MNYIFFYFTFLTRIKVQFVVTDVSISVKIRFYYNSCNALRNFIFYFVILSKEIGIISIPYFFDESWNSMNLTFSLETLVGGNWYRGLKFREKIRIIGKRAEQRSSQVPSGSSPLADHSSSMEINGGHQKGVRGRSSKRTVSATVEAASTAHVTSARALAQVLVSRLTAVKARFPFHSRLKLYANRGATLNYPSVID